MVRTRTVSDALFLAILLGSNNQARRAASAAAHNARGARGGASAARAARAACGNRAARVHVQPRRLQGRLAHCAAARGRRARPIAKRNAGQLLPAMGRIGLSAEAQRVLGGRGLGRGLFCPSMATDARVWLAWLRLVG